MNRRQFLKRGSLFVAATALLEPGELAEMLAPRRLYVRGWDTPGWHLNHNRLALRNWEVLDHAPYPPEMDQAFGTIEWHFSIKKL